MSNSLYMQILHIGALAVVGFLLIYVYVTKGDPTPLWIPFGALVGVALPSPFTPTSSTGSLPTP